MKRLSLVVLLSLGVVGCGPDSQPPQAAGEPNTILTNARVYTLDWPSPGLDGTPDAAAPYDADGWRPDAGALVIEGSTIAFVGTTDAALGYRHATSTVVDLNGAVVIPGLVDSHTHVFELGALLDRVSLVDARDEAEAVALVAARARTTPPGTWIMGLGWDEGAWADNYPDKRLLTEAVPDHPVLMRGLHGFADWGNQMALDVGGITASTPVPTGGEIRLGADGEPDGLFLNRAVEVLRAAMPEPGADVLRRQFLLGAQRMIRDGYVAVHEAGVSSAQMAVLEQLEVERALPIRLYAMLSLRDEPLIRRWVQRGPDRDADSMLVTRAVKAYYDGALGSRGARLLADYSDRPGHRGISGAGYGFDEQLMGDAIRAGFQIGIHAIGDAGNREVLDLLQREIERTPAAGTLRHRIEHAQVLHPVDLPRLGAMGLVASMEPPHAVEDKAWAESRIGPERVRGAYAWRSLRQTNAALTFNSDNPGSDHDIFYGLHAAVTRRDRDLEPAEGWYADEAVTIEEAVRAYTHWAAYASFRENDAGILAPGRWADVTVLDIDPFVVAERDPARLLDGAITMTIIRGDIVYPR